MLHATQQSLCKHTALFPDYTRNIKTGKLFVIYFSMSEMLGNYYFMISRYKLACHELENALKRQRHNNDIRKKLILCYLDSGYFSKAYNLFRYLIKQDIADTFSDLNELAGPSRFIMKKFKKQSPKNMKKKDYYKVLAILSLYEDIPRSIEYFEITKSLSNNDKSIDTILKILSKAAGCH